MPKTKFCSGLSDFNDSCQAIIFDGWGTLHNGTKLFEGVEDGILELRERKKTILIMANSLKTAEEKKGLLKSMGLGPSLYDAILTPGELLRKGFEQREGQPFENLGQKYYSFHMDEQYPFLEGLDIERVDEIKQADFILLTGWDKLEKPVAEYTSDIRQIIQCGIKIFCAAPDSRALLSPNYLMGAGLLIRKIREAGGVIHVYGKPYKPIYHEAIRILQEKQIYPAQCIMIGDTMAHDMIGAASNGMETCMVRTGLHGGAFKFCSNLSEIDRALNILIAQYNIMPTYLMESVKWGKPLPDRKHRRRRQPGEKKQLRRIRRRPVSAE